MKFKELVSRAEKALSKYEQGKPVKPSRLSELQQLLTDKKARYETKLATLEDPAKRKKLETRLRVVNAQLEKSMRLTPRS